MKPSRILVVGFALGLLVVLVLAAGGPQPVYHGSFVGDGSGLTNLPVAAQVWTNSAGIVTLVPSINPLPILIGHGPHNNSDLGINYDAATDGPNGWHRNFSVQATNHNIYSYEDVSVGANDGGTLANFLANNEFSDGTIQFDWDFNAQSAVGNFTLNWSLQTNNTTFWSVDQAGVTTMGGAVLNDGTPGQLMAYQGGNHVGPTNLSTMAQSLGFVQTNDTRIMTFAGPIYDTNIGASKIVRTDGNNLLAPVTIGSGVAFDGTTLSATGSGGSVTSVALTEPAEFSVSGSPVTTSGTLAVTKANQTANTVWAGPTSGGAAAPTFRGLVAADLPGGSASITLNGTANHITTTSAAIALGGSATLDVGSSVALKDAVNQFTKSNYFQGPVVDTNISVSSLAGTDAAGNLTNLTVGSGLSLSGNTLSATGGGTVTSVALSLPNIFTVSGSPVTGSGTLTGTLATESANTFFAGPTSGGAVAPTFRAMVSADIPSGIVANSSLANSTVNFSGTANQITGGGSTALGGTATPFAIASPLTTPGAVTITGKLNWPTGLGSIMQINGPTDQALIATSSPPAAVSTSTVGNALDLYASPATAGTTSGGNTAANGGAVNIIAGNAAVDPANAGAPVGVGGAINLTGGIGAPTSNGGNNGGAVNLTGGSSTVGSGGAVVINGGQTSGAQFGGAVTITSGKTTSASGGNGGVTIAASDTTLDGASLGTLTLQGAKANFTGGTSRAGGAVNITGQSGAIVNSATGTGGNGGASTITLGPGGNETGNTSGTGGNGGAFNVTGGVGGNATGTGTALGGNGSTLTLTSGAGGNATGASGTRTGGNSGNINLVTGAVGTGATANGTAGTVNVGAILSVTNGIGSFKSVAAALTSITFPATTVNWTNTQSFNIVMYIDNTGVTGTAIKKNATTVSASIVAGAMVTLNMKPGDYFSETYTVGTPVGNWEPL